MRHMVFLAAGPIALLAGCAAQPGAYPSLAPRPIEHVDDIVPDRPAAKATPDAALDAKVAALSKELAEADAGFGPTAGRAQALVTAAQASGAGSAAWLDAQTTLAALDGYRAQSSAALSGLDELAIARATRLQPDYPALTAARQHGEAQVDAEDSTIRRLQRQLPGT